jgi:hypothetical protein
MRQSELIPTDAYLTELEDESLRTLLGPFLDESVPLGERVEAINRIRRVVGEFSPFQSEPVDVVEWVDNQVVVGNEYNPNSVAPPEMELLRVSIISDGYTQPIVVNEEDSSYRVIDGFHRHRVGRECDDVRERIKGYLPVVQIRGDRTELPDRMASTIRHNRARGKHRVEAMSDIVVELKRRNWSNEKIGRELGMDSDEVLRLCQITGLAELFSDRNFSRSWEPVGEITEDDFEDLTDDVPADYEGARTVNTSDPGRIFHTHDTWECHKAGFYAGQKTGVSKEQGEEMYRVFLSDLARFGEALGAVTAEWTHSCEHYLTNTAMNRIAWLGQASMCYATGIPAAYRSGFGLLSESEQAAANELALEYLNRWLEAHDREPVDMEAAMSNGRQSDIY